MWSISMFLGLLIALVIIHTNTYVVATENAYRRIEIYTGDNYKKDWAGSEKFCQSKGMELLSILTKKEFDEVNQAMVDNDTISGWDMFIGARRIIGTDKFFWVKSTECTSLAHWRHDEPNNFGGDENCVAIQRKGSSQEWNDANCHNLEGFICELRW